jgi:membrane protease YdiL (CAAX protease family)
MIYTTPTDTTYDTLFTHLFDNTECCMTWQNACFRMIHNVGLSGMVFMVGAAGSVLLALFFAANANIELDWPYDMREFAVVQAATAVSTLGALVVVSWLLERPLLADAFHGTHWFWHLAAGTLLGTLLAALCIAIFVVCGWYRPLRVEAYVLAALFIPLAGQFCVALAEEVFDRGVLFRLVEEDMGTWIALLVSAGWFGFSHLGNPDASWVGGLLVAGSSGLLYGLAYVLTRTLWLGIGIHWSWNVTLGAVVGVPVSGLSNPVVLTNTASGPDLWTGGMYGPEAGLVAVGILTIANGAFLWLVLSRRCIIPPSWK